MEISHSNLIKLLLELGYGCNERGVCYGFSIMLVQAILANEEDVFFARLELIEKYNDFDQLKKDIEAIQQKRILKQTISQEESQILEILAFFDGIVLAQGELKDPGFSQTKFVYQLELKEIYPFISSLKLQNPTHEVINESYAFNHQELLAYLIDLEEIVKKSEATIPILFSAAYHAVVFYYDKENQYWKYIDTNCLAKARSMNKVYYLDGLDNEWLTKFLFAAFSRTTYLVCNLKTLSFNPQDSLLINSLRTKHFNLAEQVIRYDDHKRSLLHLLSFTQKLEMEELLKLTERDINFTDEKGLTGLFIACHYGYVDVVKKLLKHSAIDVNLANSAGASPLYMASQEGHIDVVKELLRHPQINIHQTLSGKYPPLFIACEQGHFVIVLELLKFQKIDINQGNPLFIACRNGHINIVKELLKYPKIDVNQKFENGETPLWGACVNGNVNTVKELLKNINIDVNQSNPLYIACQLGHIDIVKELLKHPVNVNQPHITGATSLFVACQNGDLSVVKILLQHKDIEIGKADKEGVTPLQIAQQLRHQTIVEELTKELTLKCQSFYSQSSGSFFCHCGVLPTQVVSENESCLVAKEI